MKEATPTVILLRCVADMSEDMVRGGRWGLLQLSRPWGRDVWSSTSINLGYIDRADAETEVERLNKIQPGCWKLNDFAPEVGGLS